MFHETFIVYCCCRSVYSFLLDAGLIDEPVYRDNELKALALMDNEFTFTRTFSYHAENKVFLHCDGLDTLCDIYINGSHIAYTDNMHRVWEFDITDALVDGENEIRVPRRKGVRNSYAFQ